MITQLSAQFGAAQALCTDRVEEARLWALARNGMLLRSFSYVGSEDEGLADRGDLTPIEESLRITLEIPEDSDSFSDEARYRWPSEADVMMVAGAWSIDLTALDEHTPAPGP